MTLLQLGSITPHPRDPLRVFRPEMPIDERRRRMRAMRAYLEVHDINAWMDGCLADAGMSMDQNKVEQAVQTVR